MDRLSSAIFEFENSLSAFHELLVKAANYYDVIFSRMLDGSLVIKELENKQYIEEILESHNHIHEMQTALSIDAGNPSCVPLHELVKKYSFSYDIVGRGCACVERYGYIAQRIKICLLYTSPSPRDA